MAITVQKATPIVTWAAPAAISYGAALGSSQLNATANVPGTFVYTPPAGTLLGAGNNQTLSATFTPNDSVDYASATDSVSLVVAPATLTVTAANASRAFGQTNPVFTGTITGLTNGDNITAAYSCSASTNSPAGTYPIVPSLLDPNNRQTNYTVSLINGTLTVTSTTNSVLANLFPSPVPESDASLRVFTQPADAGGQWKLVWEGAWHNSGDIITALPQGNYPVEFSPVAGFTAAGDHDQSRSWPATLSVVTNQYAVSGLVSFGSFSVDIQPSTLASASDPALQAAMAVAGRHQLV